MPPPRNRRPGTPGTSRTATSEGKGRFRALDPYRVAREWARYEGTPHRELLESVRVRFLRANLPPAKAPLGLDVGSGPGRSALWVEPHVERLVLIDVSREALQEARQRLSTRLPGTPLSYVRADAVRLPTRRRSVGTITLMGNVLGFSDDDADEVLREAAGCLAPGGRLILETYTPVHQGPSLPPPEDTAEWRRLLEGDPKETWDRLARRSWVRRPPREVSPSFAAWSPGRVIRRLRAEGLVLQDRSVAAPLTGDQPSVVEALTLRSPSSLEKLVKLEETAGRDRRTVASGGTVLWAASSAATSTANDGFDWGVG